jgi:hypothetical protein
MGTGLRLMTINSRKHVPTRSSADAVKAASVSIAAFGRDFSRLVKRHKSLLMGARPLHLHDPAAG